MPKRLLLILLWGFLLGCGQTATPPPSPTPVPPTSTTAAIALLPTHTPTTSATLTPIPSLTYTPTPSPTNTPTATPTATATPTITPTPTAEPSYEVKLAAVGDLMFDRTLGRVLRDGRLDYPFAGVVEYLINTDVTVGNLETALGTGGEPAPKAYPFISPPETAESLARAGFDIVSLANNHALDYGTETLMEGIGLLRAAGVEPIGAGANAAEARRPYIIEVNGLRLAFLAYANVPVEARSFYDVQIWDATEDTPGMAWGTVERVVEDVSAVAPLVDHVIVVVHAGYEYVKGPSNEQYNISHAAIDAGATLYIGHHAHILQAIEQYQNGLIVYSLGNFAFNIDGPPETAIIHITLGQEGVLDWRLFPAMVTETGAPRMATAEETARILADVPLYITQSWVPRE